MCTTRHSAAAAAAATAAGAAAAIMLQAFIMAGLKYKLGSRPEDMQKIMQNTCLINAILKQHIIPGDASSSSGSSS
jgi:hypothetical protein